MSDVNIDWNAMSPDEFSKNLIIHAEELGPGITSEEIDQVEAVFSGEALGVTRRLALSILNLSFPELREKVVADDEFAAAVADTFECLNTRYYTDTADLLQAAQLRMMVALSYRHDMDEVLKRTTLS
ncbi:hypothetical protein [Sedimenticola selenatireducens]|uniref:Uncharacterized protein n=1 Tax=Sedimenticola selenatireducens TaxID=191960 RepID=A0A557SNQ4_9GAMM|nr:hypothetical protein [Sedimenticola selenatireducens]TVO79053.1 hypothetical protein FHP88_00375 [Sedimenticola selenatireducens]TVT67155.1 MAG: hypothetical protein FHK78_00020 [Sedimenticola selenatireducens]